MALTMASPRRPGPRGPRRSRSRSMRPRRPQRRSSRGETHKSEPNEAEEPIKEVKEAVKSARDKAKEQMEKEREKARLKRAERDSASKEKEQQRKDFREQKREEAAIAIAQSVELSSRQRAAENKGDSLNITAQSEAEQQAEAQAAAVAAAAQSIERKRRKPQATPPPAVEEGQIRKLFELLDGKSKGEVSQRDVLVALKKHHPIRQLFGLVGSGEAAALQQRVERIQEAFESGSGLGEVAPTFNSLKEASGTNGSFEFTAFLSACQHQLQCNVLAAVDSLPREHAPGEAFTPTKRWSVVPPGAACPAGLEYRMDMETGQTLARLPNKKP